jgi:toxin-antitoxin system PIN domain toxin
VIAVDTNILVHAHRADSQWHVAAAGVVAELARGWEPWAVPWPVVNEFLAVVTHPRIFRTPTPIAAAADQVDAWLESPTITVLAESSSHWSELRALLVGGHIVGAKVHDARIAALCLNHGVSLLLTADRDFSRFPSLATRNPLVS